MDEGLSEAVLETFLRLHEKGLIFRGKYIVNWCPRCRTALSDIEVEHEELDGHLWHIRYPFADDPGRHLIVATTRPETMLGDTAVAVHPDDERYGHLIGEEILLPLRERRIPIIADDWVDPKFGTGAVKVTPAHDPNDFEISRRHDLPRPVVIDEDARMTPEAGDAYEGMDRFECREAVVSDLKARKLLEKVEPHVHSVGHCYRCHMVVEPYLSDQWYVKTKPLADKAVEAARSGRVSFHPDRWKDFYLSWLEEARDWCISRQIWWGHRLPVYYCTECEEPVIARDTPSECPNCDGTEFRQSEDVLDTWFSSALWPFSTLGWPEQTPELDRYYPTDTLVTDRGIIYFWVARMVMMGLEFMGDVPFSDVYINGTILDEQGRKMSKSLGNGIDPIDMIERFGADATRFSLVTLATEGQDLKLSDSKFEMGRHFANKIWNAVRFAMMSLGGSASDADAKPALRFEDRWILSRLQASVNATTSALDEFRPHDAALAVYDFFWHELCDWYLEIIKPRLGEDAEPEDAAAAKNTLVTALDASLRLLHPFTPFITEELWQHLKEQAADSAPLAAKEMESSALIRAAWPEDRPERRDAKLEADMQQLQEIVRAIRNVRKEKGLADRTALSATISAPDAATDQLVAEHERFLKQMGVLEELHHGEHASKPPRCVTAVVGTVEIFVPLAGLIDLDEEKARLQKQRADLEGQIKNVDRTLNDARFRANAPEQVVRQKIERADDLRAELEKVIQNLADLE